MVEERLCKRQSLLVGFQLCQYFGVEHNAFYYTSRYVDSLYGGRRKRKVEKKEITH